MQTKLLGRQGNAGLDFTRSNSLYSTGAMLVLVILVQTKLPGTGAVLVLAIHMQTKLPGTGAVLCRPSSLALGQGWF